MMRRSKQLTARMFRRTVVTTQSGDAWDGLLVAFDGVVVELAQASLIGTAGTAINPAPVDGALLVPWHQVATLQHP